MSAARARWKRTPIGGRAHRQNTDWHHYTFILMATDLEPKDPALKPGMTRDELAAALGVGTPNSHVKASAGLVTRFKHL